MDCHSIAVSLAFTSSHHRPVGMGQLLVILMPRFPGYGQKPAKQQVGMVGCLYTPLYSKIYQLFCWWYSPLYVTIVLVISWFWEAYFMFVNVHSCSISSLCWVSIWCYNYTCICNILQYCIIYISPLFLDHGIPKVLCQGNSGLGFWWRPPCWARSGENVGFTPSWDICRIPSGKLT